MVTVIYSYVAVDEDVEAEKEDGAHLQEHDDSAAVYPPPEPHRLSTLELFQTIILGLLSALPTLLLIGFGAKPSISTFCIYIALLIVSAFIFIKNDIE